MDTKALRQKILDLAIRGKLVPQDPNDEPASVLLERIRAQKQQMVREGKLKSKDIKDDTVIFVGEDNLHYEKLPDGSVKCIEDEIPFELPDGWAWLRLQSFIDFIGGSQPPKSTFEYSPSDDNIRLIQIRDYKTDKFMTFIPRDKARRFCSKNDVMIGRYGPPIFQILRGLEGSYNVALMKAVADPQIMLNDYLFYLLQDGELLRMLESLSDRTCGQDGINMYELNRYIVGIPPLNEQRRILDFIEKAVPLVENVTKLKEEMSALIFQAKSKILDMAIRGRLVPQDPADEPASLLLERIRAEKEELIKQGKIKRDKKESFIFRGDDNSYYEKVGDQRVCIDDDLPYSLPEGWVWCELQDCCIKEIKRGRSPKYADNGHVLSFAQKCNQKTGGINMGLALLIDDSTACRYEDDEYLQDGDIVINSTGTGTLGRVGIYRATDNLAGTPVVPDSHVTVVRVSSLLDPLYFFYCLKSMQSRLETLGEGSTNQKELKPLTVQQLRIPIPPIAEQNEIVKQIVALFGHLDAIATDLT